MITIRQRLEYLHGVGPGFDSLRVALSTLIFGFHCYSTSYGETFSGPKNPVGAAIVTCLLPLFFALSGFLVTGSAVRVNSITRFLSLRILRIAPALITEIVISSLLIGFAVTSLSASAYINDPLFSSYFGSIIGRVRFVLPGVFVDNPIPSVVNVSLWTIPPEICCYVAMTLTILYRAYKNKYAMAVFTAIFVLVNMWLDITSEAPSGIIVSARMLVVCFFIGSLAYLWGDFIPYDFRLFFIFGLLGIALVSAGIAFSVRAGLEYLAFPLLTYALVYLGLCKMPKLPFFSSGDYSYGIYLYGFPLQQTVVYFSPGAMEWYVVAAVGYPLTLLAAFGSWHMIERPFLQLRNKLKGSVRFDSLLMTSFMTATFFGSCLAIYVVLLARWSGILTSSFTTAHKVAIVVIITMAAAVATLVSQSRIPKPRGAL